MTDEKFYFEAEDDVAYIMLPNGQELPVPVGDMLGAGVERICYATDLTYEGRRYVLKAAWNPTKVRANLFEVEFHDHLKATAHPYYTHLPHILGKSESGVWMLVERVHLAYKAHDPNLAELPFAKCRNDLGLMCDTMAHQLFPQCFQADLHCSNWGYTEEGHRPVVIDFACGDGGRSQLSEQLGLHFDESVGKFEGGILPAKQAVKQNRETISRMLVMNMQQERQRNATTQYDPYLSLGRCEGPTSRPAQVRAIARRNKKQPWCDFL